MYLATAAEAVPEYNCCLLRLLEEMSRHDASHQLVISRIIVVPRGAGYPIYWGFHTYRKDC